MKTINIIHPVDAKAIQASVWNLHLYNYYHFYLSVADRRTLNTIGSMINHIIYHLKDGNSSL